MRRASFLLTFAAVIGAAVAIVFFVQSRPGEQSLSAGQAAAQMRAELAKLTFPPGYQVPQNVEKLFAQPHTVYAPGVAEALAGDAWFCAWGQEWRTYRASDPSRAIGAIDTILAPYPGGPFWQSINPPDRPGLLNDINTAKLGDPRGLLSEVAGFSCTQS